MRCVRPVHACTSSKASPLRRLFSSRHTLTFCHLRNDMLLPFKRLSAVVLHAATRMQMINCCTYGGGSSSIIQYHSVSPRSAVCNPFTALLRHSKHSLTTMGGRQNLLTLSRTPCLAVCVLLCLLAPIAWADLSASFDTLCSGKDRVVVPHPTDCHQYVACCKNEGVNVSPKVIACRSSHMQTISINIS